MHNLLSTTLLSLLVLSPLTTPSSSSSLNSEKADDCKPSNCGGGGPEIRFPFRIKGIQPRRCGYPGFGLSCKANSTFIHFPHLNASDQHLLVEKIDYEYKRLLVADPKNCLVALLLNNTVPNNILKATPFYFKDGELSSRTLVTCDRHVRIGNYHPISCLGDSMHDVFAIYSNNRVGTLRFSCRRLARPTLNFVEGWNYRLDFADQMLLPLTWDLHGCDGCEQSGGRCGFNTQHTADTLKCFYHHRKQGSWKKYLSIIGAGIGSVLLLLTTIISLTLYYSSKQNKKLALENNIMVEKFLEEYKSLNPTRYSYADLKRMTNQFKEKLGQGGFGTVFKGMLSDGTFVAVKIFHSFGGDGKEFMNEVATIGRIHHINVVRLLGFCSDRLKRALIYEFMPNESLEKLIFSRNIGHRFLGWMKLQDIAIGIARGVEYLHQGCDQRILHFDIKPHNILLDQDFNPKISDFGMAKLCSRGRSMVSMTTARGTMGYIAPEVLSRNFGNVSYKSDVYSFGMLLLDMVGGGENKIDPSVAKASQEHFPAERVCKHLHLEQAMGLNTVTSEDAQIARKLVIVGIWCIQWQPSDRPSMNSVVQMLEGNSDGLVMPPEPFGLTTSPETTDKGRAEITNLSTILESV